MPNKHSPAFLRQPALSSDASQLAFSSGGDLWLAPAGGGKASRLTAHGGVDRYPIFSPDSNLIAFSSYRTGGGNIYIARPGSSSAPRQLTWHTGSAPPQAWSPDGEWIYFAGDYDGLSRGIYKVPTMGGQPVEVATLPREGFYDIAVSPCGRRLAFCNNGDQWWRKGPNPSQGSDIWLLEMDGRAKTFRKLTNYRGRNIRPMWSNDGSGLFFLSDRNGVENIWYVDTENANEPKAVSDFSTGRLTRPAISRDGSEIVFERDFAIWSMSTMNGQSRRLALLLDRDEKRNPVGHYEYSSSVSEFALSADGKKMAFCVRGSLFADIAEKDAKNEDHGSSFALPASGCREEMVAWHPNSKDLFYVSDRDGIPQIYHYDFSSHNERQLTSRGQAKYSPKVSPDGKWLAFLSGQDEIRLLNLSNGKNRKFISDQLFMSVPDPTDFAWSPDSRWIAFVASDDKFFSNIYVQKLGWKTPRQLTFLSNVSAYNPMWSPDGRYLLFNSGQYRAEQQIALVELAPRKQEFKEDAFQKLFLENPETKEGQKEDGNPETQKASKNKKGKKEPEEKKLPEIEIVFEGVKQRLCFLTDYRQNAYLNGISPDGKLLIFSASIFGEPSLWSKKLDPEKWYRQPGLVVRSFARGSVYFSGDSKKMYYLSGGRISRISLNGNGDKSGNPSRIPIAAEVKIDFHRDKQHVFDEAWRLIDSHFYDREHHGADWKKVRKRMEPAVEGILVRDELIELLNRMVGELNASHLGAAYWRGAAPDSYLGLFFDQQALEEEGRFLITRILKNGPAALADNSPTPGEYLLKIGGQDLAGNSVNISRLMLRKAGKKISLSVGKSPEDTSPRTIFVKPADSYEYRSLCYTAWKNDNLEYVKKRSNGRLGYVHIPAMSHSAYMNFLTDLDSEIHHREGVVIDVRFNGGGHIASFILDVLSRKTYAMSSWRGGAQNSDTHFAGGRILSLPTILLTNEHSGSNAEVFSEGYRQLKLGKVVGRPTMGAVIWTVGLRLKDGISFRLPRFKAATIGGENTEGQGRPVDIDVDRHLSEGEQGIDSQLDAAVDQLLSEIDQ